VVDWSPAVKGRLSCTSDAEEERPNSERLGSAAPHTDRVTIVVAPSAVTLTNL
jgi:hypothetical protein